MGVYNEQGEAIGEPQPHHMLIKEIRSGRRPRRSMSRPMALCRLRCRAPPKDTFNNKMFVVGGWTQEDPSCLVEQFCPEYNEWRTAAPMVSHRGNVAVCALGGEIYTVGGEDNIRCYSDVERYNTDTDSWRTDVASLSSPRSGVSLVELDGYLYAIGGYDGIAAVNTVERYDPKTNTWSKQTPMTTRRTRAAAAVLDGYIYVIGGHDGVMALSSVERYSPLEGTWSVCPSMKSPRENAGCTVYLGRIYMAGGKDELGLQLCTVEKFDPDTMRWGPVKRMKCKRNHVSLAVFNGALLAMGGCDGVTNLKTIEVYSHETNTWRHFGSMKARHPGGRAVVLN